MNFDTKAKELYRLQQDIDAPRTNLPWHPFRESGEQGPDVGAYLGADEFEKSDVAKNIRFKKLREELLKSLNKKK